MNDKLQGERELLPCPFCGNKQVGVVDIADHAGGDLVAVGCGVCGCNGTPHIALMDDARPAAIASWNRRAALASDAEPVAEVVLQKLADFMPPKPTLIWHNDDLPVGPQFYTEAPSTAQAVEAAIRKAAEGWKETLISIRRCFADAPNGRKSQRAQINEAREIISKALALIHTEAAQVERDAKDAEDAARYRRIRLLGAAPFGTTQLDAGTVLRFQSLDEFVDKDLRLHPHRGEAIASANREG